MSKWNFEKLRNRISDKKSLRQITDEKKKITLNPFAKIQAKKEAKQKEIDKKNELKRIELERKEEEERLALLKDKKKKHNIIKLIIGMLILIASIVLWPILLPASLVGLWYFSKKKPNVKMKKHAKNFTIINVIGLILMIAIAESDVVSDPVDNFDTATVVEDVEADAKVSNNTEAKSNEHAQKIVKEREELLAAQKEVREQRRKEKEELEAITEANPNKTGEIEAPSEPVEISEDTEEVKFNDNIPRFSNEDITSTEVYHRNGPLDSLGRVTAANAVVGVEIMPAEQRGSIGHHEPTGWSQARYANIDSGGWLYNRSHLIGHQLTGNDDYANLMTGTRSFNMRMLEYENFVANYVETTENHVRYRVTPVFEGNNLIASGVYMEGFSIEDNGEGLMFNIYIPNTQPGVTINYANGSSVGPEGPSSDGEITQYKPPKDSTSKPKPKPVPVPAPKPKPAPAPAPAPAPKPAPKPSNPYVDENGNGLIKGSKSKIYHVPGSTYYDKTTNPVEMFKSIAEAEAAGYRAPKR